MSRQSYLATPLSTALRIQYCYVHVVHFCTQAPVVISRDHHDVSGTDSPYRETSNIDDGSAFTAGK